MLDDQTRELITVTVLACLQTLPQLTSHTAAALNVGVPPVQIREAIYQLAPFIGFPRTLNAVATINEVFGDQRIGLPLPTQGTVSDADRYSKGFAEQAPLYGDEIKDNLADLPEPFNEALPRFLTEFCFGDFYTRGGLTLAQRELLVLCALATIGDTAAQLGPHGRACIQVGQLQDRRGRRARALLPLHRVPALRRCRSRGQALLATGGDASAAPELEVGMRTHVTQRFLAAPPAGVPIRGRLAGGPGRPRQLECRAGVIARLPHGCRHG